MISWVILTWNRADTFAKSFNHNLAQCGMARDRFEIIWVDNGSTDEMPQIDHDVKIQHAKNLGIARGYNVGWRMARGEYIVITGPDTLMPEGWMQRLARTMPHGVDVICSFYDKSPDRFLGPAIQLGGIVPFEACRALPVGDQVMFKREVLEIAGYLREDFGLYGWEDVEWANRILNFGLRAYYIDIGPIIHMESAAWPREDGSGELYEFKKKESTMAHKQALLAKCRADNWPAYDPYQATG